VVGQPGRTYATAGLVAHLDESQELACSLLCYQARNGICPCVAFIRASGNGTWRTVLDLLAGTMSM
jgi:hypothetical protein